MKELNSNIIEKWERIKLLVATTEEDVFKNARGNASAGVRARKGLRTLKTEVHELVMMSVTTNKKQKAKD